MQLKLIQIEERANHASEMQRAENKQMQANIIREIQSSQEAYNQRLEKAQLERETRIISDMNERFDRFQDEKAKLDTRAMEQKGELHAKGLKRTKDAAQKAANETAKVKVQTENLNEMIEVTKQENENIKRQAYLDELRTKGAENAKKVGEARAQQELEKQRLEREIEYEKKHQESLLEHEIVAKQSKQIIDDLQGHIQQLKKSDPISRLTGDPSLIEVDLFMLGEEKERYEEAQRNLATTRVHQHAMLDMSKEVDALATELKNSGQGITFSSLYNRDPASIVRAMGDLVQLRQGRKELTKNLSSIFPAIQTKLNEIEQRSQALASREQQFESEKSDILNQARDTNVMNQRLLQENALLKQHLGMPS